MTRLRDFLGNSPGAFPSMHENELHSILLQNPVPARNPPMLLVSACAAQERVETHWIVELDSRCLRASTCARVPDERSRAKRHRSAGWHPLRAKSATSVVIRRLPDWRKAGALAVCRQATISHNSLIR
jgi:hypothetical protein